MCSSNMIPESIYKVGLRFLSSKKEEAGHDFGMKNIRRIVDHANVQYDWLQKSRFHVEIALLFQKKEP